MSLTRQQICQQAGRKLAGAAATVQSTQATIGLDGFVDEIIAVVDKRQDKDHYQPVRTIAALAGKIQNAAGQSSNYELLVKQTKLGGNGPIMANALAAIGIKVTYIGNLGYPTLHPVFNELAARAKVISIAEPGHTDALEFDDGKLMLGKHQTLRDVNWDNLVSRVGKDQLKQLFAQSKLIGMVNWTMLQEMSVIWQKLSEDIFPTLPKGERTLFIDLADPEKRTHEDILQAMNQLTKFQKQVNVILGLNLKESDEVAKTLGLAARGEAEIEQTAKDIRAKLGVGTVVIHPRRGAAAATATASASFAGPFVQSPRISTGAGDHFNAGFALGRVLGLELEESLCVGTATSGYYVRNAQSPSCQQLAEFVVNLPAPQG